MHTLTNLTSLPGVVGMLGLPASTGGLLLGLLLALCTPFVLVVARRRVVAQPLSVHLEEERRIISTLLARPSCYVYVHQLRGTHFVNPDLGALWDLIAERNRDVVIPETPGEEKAAYALLEGVEAAIPADLQEHLRALADRGGLTPPTRACLEQILDTIAGESEDNTEVMGREKLVSQASLVYNAGIDRHEFAGSARIETTGEAARPLRRLPSRPTVLRTTIAAGLLGVGGYVAGAVAGLEEHPVGRPAIAAALVLLTVGSVIWTLVDLETMYVDMASFYAFGGASWSMVLVAAVSRGTLGQALTGLLVVAGIVGFIEVVNQVYRRVRGRHGMGMGDYLLVLATIGVPVGLTGNLMLGQVILIVSLLAGIVGWVFTRLTRPGFTRETPYAFGPYLATGWLLGVLIWGIS